jgi:hypothetical protein
LVILGGRIVDAVEHLQHRIAELSHEIKYQKQLRVSFNSGTAFVVFASRLQVSRCIDKQDMYDLAMNKLETNERVKWKVLRWKIKQASSQSDIIWENLFKDKTRSKLKSYFLLGLLLFVCIFLVTPILLIQQLTPIVKALQEQYG